MFSFSDPIISYSLALHVHDAAVHWARSPHRRTGMAMGTASRNVPRVWLESGVSRVGANTFPWLFGWRMGGLGWLQSGIFFSDAGWTRPSKSGGRSRSSRVDVHQTLNSFNQTLNGAAPSLILQPNTEMGWVCPKIEVQPNTLLDWLRPQKLSWIQPNPPNPNQTHGY